ISRAASGTEASERIVAAPTVMTSDAFMLHLLRSIALEDARRAFTPYVSQFWRPDRTNPLAARLFDPRQYPGRRLGLGNKEKARRTTMKVSMIATALMLAATTAMAMMPGQTPGQMMQSGQMRSGAK